MCIIIDSNKWTDFSNQTDDMKPVHKWLEKHGKLVYSDDPTIKKELRESQNKTLIEYLRAGKAVFISSEKVSTKVEEIQKSKYQLKSNDIHILGLAKASNVKVLCTKDKKLHHDFKKVIIKGSIYQDKDHQHLLTPDLCI